MTKERMILGEGCIYSMDSRETGRNNNVIVCGSSGSGKTMSVSEPRLLETTDSSLIASVTKKRLVEKYTPLFQKRGYEILHLNFAKPMESSCSYDPLLYVEDDADITFLAKSIVMADQQKEKNTHADPYWNHAAVSLLSAEIAYTRMTKEDATFADVLVLHDSLVLEEKSSLVQTSLDSAFHRIALENPGCFAASCWRSFKNLPTRTAGCVFGTLNTIIDTFFSQELRKMMSAENRIDLEQLGMKKTVLFLSSSPVNPSLHGFMNLFFAQAFKQLFEYAESRPDGVLPVPVHVLGDDFATGGCIYNFPEHISIFREKGISVTLLLQSESQLEQMYGPANASAILDNCDSYVYLGGMDLWTARKISLRLDVPLEEILSMPVGQEVVFRRGQHPVVTRRYDILQDKLYQKVTEDYNRRMDTSLCRLE